MVYSDCSLVAKPCVQKVEMGVVGYSNRPSCFFPERHIWNNSLQIQYFRDCGIDEVSPDGNVTAASSI